MQSVIDKIKALPNTSTPDGMWSTLRRAKEKKYGTKDCCWKKTPLKLLPKPSDALALSLIHISYVEGPGYAHQPVITVR